MKKHLKIISFSLITVVSGVSIAAPNFAVNNLTGKSITLGHVFWDSKTLRKGPYTLGNLTPFGTANSSSTGTFEYLSGKNAETNISVYYSSGFPNACLLTASYKKDQNENVIVEDPAAISEGNITCSVHSTNDGTAIFDIKSLPQNG